MRYTSFCALILITVCHSSCKQNHKDPRKIIVNSENQGVITSHGPKRISRNIVQDKKGNIWIAAFDGIFRFDGKSFTNITSKVTSIRFFSILEDKKGNFWFGSLGSGVYYYDGKSFTNFTTRDGLLNNEVGSIYEDQKGDIWFGVSGGASCYNGKTFRNYLTDGNGMHEDYTGKNFPNRQLNGVTTIIEDRKKGFWFGAFDGVYHYDGKAFIAFTNKGRAFKNVRSIIEDKAGNIWLGGADGLWRYNGGAFTNFTRNFVGHVYEDRDGNIWTTAQKANEGMCIISRYDGHTLMDKEPTVTEIESKYEGNKGMIFGVLEAIDGSFWFGSMNGVYHYDTVSRSPF